MMASAPRTKQAGWLTGVFAILMLGLAFTGAPLAQTQTTASTDVRHFEVIAVDGNRIVVRDERGTNEYTVPADFRFMVDGKPMAASELKAGMKGTATVTTTTTITPVYVTEIRKGVVLQQAGMSVTVLDDTDKQRKRFTQRQLDDRGLRIYKDGKPVIVSQLSNGDAITATIVSQQPPQIVTEQEVNVALAKNEPAPAKTEPMAAKTEAAPAKSEPMVAKTETPPAKTEPANTPAPTVVAQATTPPATTPADTTAAPAPTPAPASSGIGTLSWLLLFAVVIVAGVFLVRRQQDDTKPAR